jgi:ABC-type glycerol-3-phosphate transport system substrate-binding protein
MEELFKKYINNQGSPEEAKQLLTYFNNAENEILLKKVIAEYLADQGDAYDESKWHPAIKEIFLKIKNQIKARDDGRTFQFTKP